MIRTKSGPDWSGRAILGWVLGPLWAGFGVDLRHLWAVLGASWLQESGSWAIFCSKLGRKLVENRSQERSEMLSIR